MELLSPECWPLWFICIAMIASAVIDWWMFKVPNWLTFPIIISGWIFGLIHTFGGYIVPGDGVGGIGDSLAGTAWGFALLLPIYAIGGMGAGDVKMTMGFGSWMGAFFGIAVGWWHIMIAFFVGAIAGGIIGLGMMAIRRQYRQNLQTMQVIAMDLFTAGSIGKIAAKAKERRPRWHRLPYGVPLCIGFVGYLLVAHPLQRPAGPDGTPAAQSSTSLRELMLPKELAACSIEKNMAVKRRKMDSRFHSPQGTQS
jgi:prepilin peptidase CpaA